MPIISRSLKSVAVALAFAGAALVGGVAPAQAAHPSGGVAERCDGYKCSYIYCNYTGDRCYRVDRYRDGYEKYRGYYGYGYGDEYIGRYRHRRHYGHRRYHYYDRNRDGYCARGDYYCQSNWRERAYQRLDPRTDPYYDPRYREGYYREEGYGYRR